MAKDVGTAIHKSIVVLFLPSLVCFFGIPSLHGSSFFQIFFVTCFFCFFKGDTFLADVLS